MINVRQKGQSGERAVYKLLNDEADLVRREMQLPELEKQDMPFQRNQNQSAVGGSDLTNPFGLEIEVKNCKTLSLGSWWQQTVHSAARTCGTPVLIYKVQYKGWRARMLADAGGQEVLADISIEDFRKYAGRVIHRYYVSKSLS